MSGTITLKTKRLVLRRYTTKDVETLYHDYGCNKNMRTYTGWNPYPSLEATKELVENTIKSYENPRTYSWAIEREGKMIGTIAGYDYHEQENTIELGISIAQPYCHQGYASEAVQAVIDYLSLNEKIKTIKAWCARENLGSKKAMEKCGMILESVDRNALKVEDHTYDLLNYVYRSDVL